ncbi:hypothetical protein [Pseudomonas aeruginosa]|uniref:hypothetical protein n=1 Tax=Pseudomonas aeruginosa TaxID=287 RepID=UPI001049EE28|nr:hypothetical protein [Pseudomonas aeruginosa]
MSDRPFQIGDKVRVREDALDGYIAEYRNKMSRGRVGVITGFPPSWGGKRASPIVMFPKDGRRKEFRAGQLREGALELVEAANPAD